MSIRPEGVVFDVDGVLFDTERLAHGVWLEVSARMGWPQVGQRYLEFVGQNRADLLQAMLEQFGPDFPRETFMEICSLTLQERMEREGVPVKAGVTEILGFLQAHQIPAALATSTRKERTERRMDMTGLGRYFQTVITGDQVAHSKPNPEIYQIACRRLGVDPAHTLAVEDSPNGIRSASAAGMLVVMIPDLIPPTPELEKLLFRRFDSLLELRDWLSGTLESEPGNT